MNKLWLPSRRSLIKGAGAAFLTGPVAALENRRVWLGGIPSWVLKVGGQIAAVDIDRANNRAYVASVGIVPVSTLLSISRASGGTDLLPTSLSGASYQIFGNNVLRNTLGLGDLAEEARINNLLNATLPTSQLSASLATGTYTVWPNGPGSVTPSGSGGGHGETATITGAAPATNGAPNTFVVTVAGTVFFNVIGSLNAFQCELGSFGTSLIVTAGAPATRAADSIQAIGALLAALQLPAATIAVKWDSFYNFVNSIALAASSPVSVGKFVTLQSQSVDWFASNTANSGSITSGTNRTVGGWNFSGSASVAANGAAAVSSGANDYTGSAASFFVGQRSTATQFINGHIQRLAVFPSLLPTSRLSSLSGGGF